MVNYIVYVYGQVWLQAKHNPSLTNGSFHLHQEISLVEKHCTEAEKEILRPSIQRNSYFAHPEWVILGGLFDPDLRIRKKAVDYIQAVSILPLKS